MWHWMAWLVLLSLPLQGMAIALQSGPAAAHYHLPVIGLSGAEPPSLLMHDHDHDHERAHEHGERPLARSATEAGSAQDTPSREHSHHHDPGVPGVVYVATDGEAGGPASQGAPLRVLVDLAPWATEDVAAPCVRSVRATRSEGPCPFGSRVVAPLDRPPR